MAKRFIDTEVWQSERFLDATIETKLLTIYLFTNCNYIGVFKKSLRLVSFEVGFTVTKQSVLECPVDIELLSDSSFWLSSFCFFQYGELKESCRPHKKYISELKKIGLFDRVSKGYLKGINTLEEQDKEQDKEQEKELETELDEKNEENDKNTPVGVGECSQELFIEPIVEIEETTCLTFDQFWDLYDKKVGRKTCEPKWKKIKEGDREKIKTHVPFYKASEPNKKFRSNPETFINGELWNNEIISNKQATPQEMARQREFKEPKRDISKLMLN